MSVDTKELRALAFAWSAQSPQLALALRSAADELVELRKALAKIDAIRNDIIGRQLIHWSEHIYPLVAALHEAGYEGAGYDKAKEAALTTWDALAAERAAHEATTRDLAELRDLRGAIVRVVREHEATKRELEDTKALLARGVELFAPLEERLQAAETALREYTGLDTKHAHIAQDYFARYGERKEVCQRSDDPGRCQFECDEQYRCDLIAEHDGSHAFSHHGHWERGTGWKLPTLPRTPEPEGGHG